MAFTTSVEIDAPHSRVWDILVEVERWPEWTDSMTQIELLDGADFALGSRVRIRQPRLPAAVWTVTEFEAGRRFTWQAPSFGGAIIASHLLEAAPGEGTRVVLTAESRGRLLRLVSLPFARMTRRYVRLEAEGLQRRCEIPDT
jgi:uncharacterized membrane protein